MYLHLYGILRIAVIVHMGSGCMSRVKAYDFVCPFYKRALGYFNSWMQLKAHGLMEGF